MHPNLKYKHTTRFNLKSSNCLKPFEVNENDLLLIIKIFSTFKAHGWDVYLFEWYSHVGSHVFPLKMLFKKH